VLNIRMMLNINVFCTTLSKFTHIRYELHRYRPQTISAIWKTISATGKVDIGPQYRPQTFSKSAVIVMCITRWVVTVFKPKPKTEVLRRNRTETEPRFSGGHVTVFLDFQKWPTPVTNVPKQQPNYRLSRTPASTV